MYLESTVDGLEGDPSILCRSDFLITNQLQFQTPKLKRRIILTTVNEETQRNSAESVICQASRQRGTFCYYLEARDRCSSHD